MRRELNRKTKNSKLGYDDHQLSITCGLCKHHSMLEVANLIVVVGGETIAVMYARSFAARRVRLKATRRIRSYWRGNSDVALDDAGVRPAKGV